MMKINRRFKWLSILALLFCTTLQAQEMGSGIAYTDSHVRFTVISDGMVRMEYAPDGKFVDEPSFICRQPKLSQDRLSSKERKRQSRDYYR